MLKRFTHVFILLCAVATGADALPRLTEPYAAAVCEDSSTPSCENIPEGQSAVCPDGSAAFCRIWRWKKYDTTNSICINGAALCKREAVLRNSD